MSDALQYLCRIQRRFYRNRSLLTTIGVISLLGSVIIYICTDHIASSFLITLQQIATIALISLAALSVIWRRALSTALSIFGLILVLGSLLFPIKEYIPSTYNQIDTSVSGQTHGVKHLIWRIEPAYAITPVSSAAMFYLGAGIIGICMVIVYKPTVLYVKNRPSDDPPYQIWDSEHSYTTYKYRDMIPLVKLLDLPERFTLVRYRYILVRICDKLYLVTPTSVVPDDSEIVRARNNKFFLGVYHTHG
ncbi:MAG: hypothetical protein QXU32_12360 [Nitrososphaerales archaeon]